MGSHFLPAAVLSRQLSLPVKSVTCEPRGKAHVRPLPLPSMHDLLGTPCVYNISCSRVEMQLQFLSKYTTLTLINIYELDLIALTTSLFTNLYFKKTIFVMINIGFYYNYLERIQCELFCVY